MSWPAGGGGGSGGGPESDPIAGPLAAAAAAAALVAQDAIDDHEASGTAHAYTAITGLGTIASQAAAAYLAKAGNLSGLANLATSRGNLGLGSAAVLTAGTAASNVVQLDGSGKLPAVDGSLLTGLPGGGSSAIDPIAVAQTAHGLVVGDIIRRTSGSYVKAQADTAAHSEVIGIVTAVAGANDFTFQPVGPLVTGLSGLTDAEVYYLDDAVAGGRTTTEPTTVDHVGKPVLIAISATAGVLVPMRGEVIGTSVAADTWDVDDKLGTDPGRVGYAAAGYSVVGGGSSAADAAGSTVLTVDTNVGYLTRAIATDCPWLVEAADWEIRFKMTADSGGATNGASIYLAPAGWTRGIAMRLVTSASGATKLEIDDANGTFVAIPSALWSVPSGGYAVITLRYTAADGGRLKVYLGVDLAVACAWTALTTYSTYPFAIGQMAGGTAHTVGIARFACRAGINEQDVETGVSLGGWL